jgi:predicted acylesterase/phospholipase RssA/CRP-like cAMP-binding protein
MSAVVERHSAEEFLRAVPVFAGFPADMRAAIAAKASLVRVPAGSWLMRQGEPGGTLYVVRSGRLEILLEHPREEVLRVLTRGAVVGELAVITESPRSASVRARRDSELFQLERAHFLTLLTEHPELGITLARELGRQLQDSRGLPQHSDAVPATVALVGLAPEMPVARFREQLTSALGRWLRVGCLDVAAEGLHESDYAGALDRCERDHDIVLLAPGAAEADDPWTGFCLRQADRTLALAPLAGGAGPLARDPRLRGCYLITCAEGPAVTGAPPLASDLDPRLHCIAAGEGGLAHVAAGIARRLAGRSVGIVLSGGGARGFAHIGVLDELRTAGVQIDRVGGCSMGAFVGAMFACGMPTEEIEGRCRQEMVERNPMSDYTVPTVSLVRGHRAEEMLRRTFGARMIECLPCEYFCVSCDLIEGELVVHRRGPLYEAVGASMCLPGIGPPVARDGRLLVDGGVLNNLPVEPMAMSAEGPVIASDVTAEFAPSAPQSRAARSVATRWLARRMAVRGAGEVQLPSLKETLTRSIAIGSVDAVALARRRADLLVEPQVHDTGMLEFGAIEHMIAAGRRAALDALAEAPEWMPA